MAWYDRLSSLFSDPLGWLAGLGSLGNLYAGYQQQRLFQDLYRRAALAQAEEQRRFQLLQNALAEQQRALGSVLGQLMGTVGLVARYPERLIARYAEELSAPLDVESRFQRLKEIGQEASRQAIRATRSDLAARGLLEGGYVDAITAETLANLQVPWWLKAAELAESERQRRLLGLSGMGSVLGHLGSVLGHLLSGVVSYTGQLPRYFPAPATLNLPPFPAIGNPLAPLTEYLSYARLLQELRNRAGGVPEGWVRVSPSGSPYGNPFGGWSDYPTEDLFGGSLYT